MAASHHTPSERDPELLSAYLDGELTDREREDLEQRLAQETPLRTELEALRATVALVRDLPRLKAPRNFTLDPAVYGHRTPWWKRLFTLDNALQLSGALGAVASVVLITLGVLMSMGEDQDDSASNASAPTVESEQTIEAPAAALAPTSMPTRTKTPPSTATPLAADETLDMEAQEEEAEPSAMLGAAPAEPGTDGEPLPGTAQVMLPTPTAKTPQPPVEEEIAEMDAPPGIEGTPLPPEVAQQAASEDAPDDDAFRDGEGIAAEAEEAPAAAPPGAMAEAGQATGISPTATPAEIAANAPEVEAPAEAAPDDSATADRPNAVGQLAEPDRREVKTPASADDDGREMWWLAGLGLVTLVASIGAIVLGRRRAKGA